MIPRYRIQGTSSLGASRSASIKMTGSRGGAGANQGEVSCRFWSVWGRRDKLLAAKVGLSPSSCLERVRKLHERQVIVGVSAKVNPRALGIGLQAFISVRLAQHSRDVVDAFREHLKKFAMFYGQLIL